MEAVRQLNKMGFVLQVVGDKIKYRYTGPGQPDRDRAKRLLSEVAVNKTEAVEWLTQNTQNPWPVQTAPGARPMLPTVLSVQDRPGGPPCYGPTDPVLEARYLADERMGMQLY